MAHIAFGIEELRKAIGAVGLDPDQPYTRVVETFDGATVVADHDAVTTVAISEAK